MKFVELASHFMKFVGLAENFYEVHRSCEQLYKVHGTCLTFCKATRPSKTLWSLYFGRSDLSTWAFSLSFACSNILIGKHKCFGNTFHLSWILFTNKFNCGCYIWVDNIFGTVKKWSLVTLDRWSIYAG